MATYAIGDVQGCIIPLKKLLEKIDFNPAIDTLWFCGDLINRGPHSLETLRYIYSLQDSAHTVLGNHDLTLLAVFEEALAYRPSSHNFLAILEAPDKNKLLGWLRTQPLLHHHVELNYVQTHAGIPPQWDLSDALGYAHELQNAIQGPHRAKLFKELYGDNPCEWKSTLEGFDRLRYICNAFTRMRLCTAEGRLALRSENEHTASEDYQPWFNFLTRLPPSLKIVFGHWSALRGKASHPQVFALDTGCVWGNCLTALRLDDQFLVSVPCSDSLALP